MRPSARDGEHGIVLLSALSFLALGSGGQQRRVLGSTLSAFFGEAAAARAGQTRGAAGFQLRRLVPPACRRGLEARLGLTAALTALGGEASMLGAANDATDSFETSPLAEIDRTQCIVLATIRILSYLYNG